MLGVSQGAMAASDRDRHDRGDRNQHQTFGRADEARSIQLRRDQVRTEQARRRHRRHRHGARVDSRRDQHAGRPFGYIRATDRVHHRS